MDTTPNHTTRPCTAPGCPSHQTLTTGWWSCITTPAHDRADPDAFATSRERSACPVPYCGGASFFSSRACGPATQAIDADVLSLASDVFALSPLDPPLPAELALRRAVVRRGKLVIDGNRARRD